MMKDTLTAYPEVLLVDATYKLNDLRMPLYTVLSIDGNGLSEIVALWITASEDKEMLQTLFGKCTVTTCYCIYRTTNYIF